MINVDTLAIVLRVLGRAAPPRSLAPAPVASVAPPSIVASEIRPALHANARADPERDSNDAVVSNDEHAPGTYATRAAPGGSPVGPATAAPAPSLGAIAISSAGTLLLDAMNVPHQERGPVIHAPAPLLASPPRDASVLARAIEQAITRSGVFYESHVARWAENDFAATELAHEPQSSWATAAGSEPPPLPHDQVAVLVRQQLEAHEAHRLLLTAELWPGQQASLRFEEPGHTRDHASETSPQDGERIWSTRIDLTLDSLGEVTAVIALRNGQIHCNLGVGTRDAHARLDDARADLDEALRRQSLELAQCAISHE